MARGIEIPISAINNASADVLALNKDLQGLSDGVSTSQGKMASSTNAAAAAQAALKKESLAVFPALESAKMGVTSFISANAALIAIAVGVGVALKAAYDFSAEGAQLERLTASGEEMARQLGGSMDEMVSKISRAAGGTVSNMDIIASSNKAMMLGLGADADELANLMEVAAFRGRAMGISTTQAFDDIVRGLGRASPMILDNLGIVIDADATYTNYARSIGKSKDELTKAEKTQALMNATLETGNEMLRKSGGLTEDNAAKVEKLAAAWKNFADKRKVANSDFGADTASTFEGMIRQADLFFSFVEEKNTVMKRAGEMSTLFTGSAVGFREYEEMAQREYDLMNSSTEATNENAEAIRLQRYALEAAGGQMELTAEQLDKLAEVTTSANKSMLSLTMSLQREMDNYSDSMENLTTKQAELSEEMAAADLSGNAKEMARLTEEYDKNAESIDALNAKHQAAMNSIAYGLLTAKLQADGFSDAEYNMAIAAGVALGQIDQATADLAVKLNDLASQQEAGIISPEQFAAGVEALTGATTAAQSAATANTEVGTSAEQAGSKVAAQGEAITTMADTGASKIKTLQSSFDKFSTNKTVQQINNVTTALGNIPTEINVTITETTSSSGASCFVAGTPILMADGSSKPIEDIKIGDEVVSYDLRTGEKIIAEVGDTFKHFESEYLVINESIGVTKNHPLLINCEWQPAGAANLGDALMDKNSQPVFVTSIDVIVRMCFVYNLHIDNAAHNYFAGGILAHNKATGGLISAPGSGNVDTGLLPVANGEYIVQANAVKQPGALTALRAINSGADIAGLGGGGGQIINIYGPASLIIESADEFAAVAR